MKNLERYKGDLERLIETGGNLQHAIAYECRPEDFRKEIRKKLGKKTTDFLKGLPSFSAEYQAWYSEAKALIRQLLPDRLNDFCGYYEKPKTRKGLTYESYRISDYLRGLRVETEDDFRRVILDASAAVPQFQQQLAIVEAARERFESSLFDIRRLVQADLFDSELEAAKALVKNGFLGPAGVVAGVVMEKHLAQVCKSHSIPVRKRTPTIADLNDALKNADVIDIPQWRFNQHLADMRNRCAHNKGAEPTEEQVNDLVDGVMKITRTLF